MLTLIYGIELVQLTHYSINRLMSHAKACSSIILLPEATIFRSITLTLIRSRFSKRAFDDKVQRASALMVPHIGVNLQPQQEADHVQTHLEDRQMEWGETSLKIGTSSFVMKHFLSFFPKVFYYPLMFHQMSLLLTKYYMVNCHYSSVPNKRA